MSTKSKSSKTKKVKDSKKSRTSKQNENSNGDELRSNNSKVVKDKKKRKNKTSKSKVKKKSKSKKSPVLGDVDYEPSLEESKEIIEKGRNGINEFKLAIFYIWLYKLFSVEPYSCATILEFVAKHYDYSKASFYRLLTQININFLIHGKYDPENHINEHICQKLKMYSQDIGEEGIKNLWEFLNTEQNEAITGILVERYVAMIVRTGILMPIQRYKALGKDVSKLKDDRLPPGIRKIEKRYSDSQVATDYDESMDEEDKYLQPDDGEPHSEDNDEVDSKAQAVKEENQDEEESEKEYLMDTEYFLDDGRREQEISLLNAANLNSTRVIKILPILNEFQPYDLLALQCLIDHLIAENF
jgi:hypothetical protein